MSEQLLQVNFALNVTFLRGDLAQAIATNPALRDVTPRHAAVMPEVTAITRGPIGVAVAG